MLGFSVDLSIQGFAQVGFVSELALQKADVSLLVSLLATGSSASSSC
jgi:hypothetical protein